jgi:hypothetical protein
MGYWDRQASTLSPQLDTVSLIKNRAGGGSQDAFYEIEPALVLDVILDKDHPYIKKVPFTLNNDKWPPSLSGKSAERTDPDYTWVGRVLVRLLYSQRNIEKEELIWAMPLEANPAEYPILNEVVGVVSYLGQYYYTRQINTANLPHANVDFNLELTAGGFRKAPQSTIEGNRELRLTPDAPYVAFQGPVSKMRTIGGTSYQGALGRYFSFNSRIRSLKRREGDFVLESRFGQSIRMGAYSDVREDDKGYNSDFAGYADYKGNGQKYKVGDKEYEAGGGNPMILIRNRQRPLTELNKDTKVYENLPAVKGTTEEKNVGGYVVEDVNNDGSSIHMTSGATVSSFKTNCLKRLWGNGSEEQTGFNGITQFKFPRLLGDQIVINSDRVIISSKRGETLHFSKKRYAVVTDDEYTVDAHNQIVFTTNNKTVLNSPAIYLGEYDQTNEPVLLGQTSVNWLYDLCQWLLIHTHWFKHTHPDAGKANPDKTQTTVQAASLSQLRDRLNLLMSRRVFVVGGGLAPGKNGAAGDIKNGAAPVVVTLPSGGGVPGGFTGANKKTTATDKKKQEDDVKEAQTASEDANKAATQASTDAVAARAALNTAARAASSSKNNPKAVSAARTASKASKSAKTNADLAKGHAATATKSAAEATTTDNDFVRIESKVATTESTNKAKLAAGAAATDRKTAENAAATATAEANKTKTQTGRR